MKKTLSDEQRITRKKRRTIGCSVTAAVLVVIIVLGAVLVPRFDANKFVPMIGGLAASYFKPSKNEAVEQFQADYGFMLGVCHAPSHDVENAATAIKQVTDANIEWTRIDISWAPYTKDENGEIIRHEDGTIVFTEEYADFRTRCRFYADNGVKVMAVTPYPQVFFPQEFESNTDVTAISEEKKAVMREYAEFYINDLKDVVGAFQISNELYHSHFQRPLASLELAAEYIGIFLEAMSPIARANKIALGYNVEMFSLYALTDLLDPYMDKIDYIGVDLYFGCFESLVHGLYLYKALLRSLYNRTGKPLIMAEFGYISKGQERTEEERNAILAGYGYADEEAVKADMEGFITAFDNQHPAYDAVDGHRVDSTIVKEARALLYDESGNPTGSEAAYNYLFQTDKRSHIYNELPSDYYLKGYAHTYEGQGKFFQDFIPYLYDIDCVVGMFIYCYAESSECYMCKQSECPVETAWGLVDGDGVEKPSYYAVQTQYGIIKAETEAGTRYDK